MYHHRATHQQAVCGRLQGLTWMSPEREVLRRMLERWVVAFPKALMCHLCYEEDLERELKVGPLGRHTTSEQIIATQCMEKVSSGCTCG